MSHTKQQSRSKTPWNETESFHHLEEMAQKPFDLTQEGVLTSERIASMTLRGCGLTLCYAFERIDSSVLEQLYQLAHERMALEQMEAMQSGQIVNTIHGFPSENRSVLHCSSRDVFEDRERTAQEEEASRLASEELAKLETFLTTYDQAFEDVVLIGIGGSHLGPQALFRALESYKKPGVQAHFVSNLDPDGLELVFEKVCLEKTCVIVVSKSGSTLETCTNEAYARSFFTDKGLDPSRHFVSVTGKGSPMDAQDRYLASFYMFDWIGGRLSATSMPGAVILSYVLGYEIFSQILLGAHRVDLHARYASAAENLPLTMALLGIWNRNFLKIPTCAVIPYSQALSRFPAHIQQLDMESNGKRIDQHGRVCQDKTGPIIWGEPGTDAQHSFFQLLHQGTDVVSLHLLGFSASQRPHDRVIDGTTSQQKLLANLFAQSIALASGSPSDNPNQTFPGNRPSLLLLSKQCTPETLGKLLALYEHQVAFQGFIWGINSFDQEGVQLGKKLAHQILEEMKTPGVYPQGRALLDLFEDVGIS